MWIEANWYGSMHLSVKRKRLLRRNEQARRVMSARGREGSVFEVFRVRGAGVVDDVIEPGQVKPGQVHRVALIPFSRASAMRT